MFKNDDKNELENKINNIHNNMFEIIALLKDKLKKVLKEFLDKYNNIEYYSVFVTEWQTKLRNDKPYSVIELTLLLHEHLTYMQRKNFFEEFEDFEYELQDEYSNLVIVVNAENLDNKEEFICRRNTHIDWNYLIVEKFDI